MINDTDLFLINDGTKTETVTAAQVREDLGGSGGGGGNATITTPAVLSPPDGAGIGDSLYTTVRYGGTGQNDTVETGLDSTSGATLVWIKNRTQTYDSQLFDTVRGAPNTITSNDPWAQTAGGLTAFTDNGFEVNAASEVNGLGAAYTAWSFKAHAGFLDIVRFTGNYVLGHNIDHNLQAVPAAMLVKNLDDPQGWAVYHKDMSNARQNAMFLNTSDGSTGGNFWASVDPTSTQFTVGNTNLTNADGKEHVAYLFADTPGLIKCGVFNNVGIGEISCGFRPGWVMWKNQSGQGNWAIFSKESDANYVKANSNEPETNGPNFSFTDDGFTVNDTNNNVFIAIAEDAMSVTTQPPDADSVVFTSNRPSVDAGAVVDWGQAEWQLATDSNFSNRQESSVQLQDVATEAGPTDFVLEEDTDYWVRVKYKSTSPLSASSFSEPNHFKTAPGLPDGWNGPFSITTMPNCSVYDIGAGPDKYVAVGQGTNTGTDKNTAFSADGELWTTVKNGIEANRAVIYAFDKWIAGGSATSVSIKYSADANTWTNASIGGGASTNTVEDFAFDGTTLLAIARTGTGRALTSLDGISWTPNTQISAKNFYSCCYGEPGGNPMWLAFNNGGQYAYTADPTGAWTDRSAPESVSFQGCAWGDGKFVIVSSSSTTGGWYSTDGLNWSVLVGLPAANWRSVKYNGNGRWVAAGGSAMAWSDDGINWTGSTPVNGNSYEYVAYGQDKWVTVSKKPHTAMWNYTGKDLVFRELFYDEVNNKVVSDAQLEQSYGLKIDYLNLEKNGIYRLTEQPDYPVEGYVKEGSFYRPIRDYSPEMKQLETARVELADARARLAIAEASDVSIGSRLSSIEADEINDDATDTALLTLIANLTQRVTNLEQS